MTPTTALTSALAPVLADLAAAADDVHAARLTLASEPTTTTAQESNP